MQATVLSLGLALVCCLQAYAEVPVQPEFQDDKLVGKWYSIGLASNSRWFLNKKDALTMCTSIITQTAEGALELTSTYPRADRCETRSMTFIKTEQPGRFRATSPRWGSEHDIRIVSTNYDEYALVYNRKAKGTDFFTMVTLYGRSKTLRPELLEKFERFALDQGLPQSSIITLPQTDRCMTDA
ncbi:lipocalin-like [Lissotriton helveticus]